LLDSLLQEIFRSQRPVPRSRVLIGCTLKSKWKMSEMMIENKLSAMLPSDPMEGAQALMMPQGTKGAIEEHPGAGESCVVSLDAGPLQRV
jgi:hypothetical protein